METNEQNKLMNKIEIEVWTHGTGWQLSKRSEEGRAGVKKVKGLVKEYVCRTHRHRQQCDGRKEVGQGAGRRWAEGAGNEDFYNSVNNKNKFHFNIKKEMWINLRHGFVFIKEEMITQCGLLDVLNEMFKQF